MAIKFPGEVVVPYKPEELTIPQGYGVSSIDPITKSGEVSGVTLSDYLPLAGGTLAGDLTITGGENIILSETTGSKIGTATTQLLGFYNATPVDQPATVADAATQDLTGAGTVDQTKLEADLVSCKNAINYLIDRLQELGLIAT